MVTTFNKREILEANKFWIEENKLPRIFKLYLNGSLDPLNQIIINCFENHYRKSNGTDRTFIHRVKDQFSIMETSGKYIACIVKYDTLQIGEATQEGDMIGGAAKLTSEEFIRMASFDLMPLMTDDDLNIWLKNEKKIQFLN